MAITAAQVKELRDQTGAGMMDAKRALEENNGEFEASVDWLRTKGLAKAAKKAGRTAAEGLVGVAVRGGKGVAVEVNSETDFVALNEGFQSIVRAIANAALDCDDLEGLKKATIDGKTVEETLTDAIAKIGENISLRRMSVVTGDAVAAYVHNAAADGLGKIGVLVGMTGTDSGIGKQIAMHVAAANPASLGEADLDPALVEREKAIFSEQARASGKPDAVIEKMIEGRMKKFFAEVTLLGQQFVINPDLTIAQAAKDGGVDVTAFARMGVGEGIDKGPEGDDFATEVAKMIKG
ncbi:MAG: translation elongation factor Ts [Deltaproteobacteria bacterium]